MQTRSWLKRGWNDLRCTGPLPCPFVPHEIQNELIFSKALDQRYTCNLLKTENLWFNFCMSACTHACVCLSVCDRVSFVSMKFSADKIKWWCQCEFSLPNCPDREPRRAARVFEVMWQMFWTEKLQSTGAPEIWLILCLQELDVN